MNSNKKTNAEEDKNNSDKKEIPLKLNTDPKNMMEVEEEKVREYD